MDGNKRVSAAELSARLFGLTQLGQLAIFSDIDGTLSPIAAQPDAAFVHPGAVAALDHLSALGVTIIFVTGRASRDAQAMVGLPHLGYAGNHGFELLTGDDHLVMPEVEAATAAIAAAVEEVERLVTAAGIDGILFEDKRYTGSVHYRLAHDPEQAKADLLPILRGVVADRGLRLTEGRLVYELRPAIMMNKGVFVSRFLGSNPHATAAFLGDDLTDVDGFTAVQEARASGALLSGLNVGIVAAESPQQVLDEADVVLGGTVEMATALSLFAAALEESIHA